MKQRIVIKVHMTCDKCRKNALAVAAKTYGVQSVGIEGEEQDQLVVVGDGVDATNLTNCLRKKVKSGRADIVKVEPVVDEAATPPPANETAAGSSSPSPVVEWPPQCYPYRPGFYCPGTGVVHPRAVQGHERGAPICDSLLGPKFLETALVHPYAGHCYVEDPCADEGSWCTIM